MKKHLFILAQINNFILVTIFHYLSAQLEKFNFHITLYLKNKISLNKYQSFLLHLLHKIRYWGTLKTILLIMKENNFWIVLQINFLHKVFLLTQFLEILINPYCLHWRKQTMNLIIVLQLIEYWKKIMNFHLIHCKKKFLNSAKILLHFKFFLW